MENNMNGSSYLIYNKSLLKYVKPGRLGKLIPNPRETLNLKTLRSISKLLGINHPSINRIF